MASQIVEAAQSLGGCRPKTDVDAMVNFFNDKDNAKAILEAADKLGGYPAKNRESWRGGGLFGSWHDYCDWEPIYKFYNYAVVCADFPKPVADVSSCGMIKSALVGLQDAKSAAISSNDTMRRTAIDMKISEYNSIYSSLNCDQWFIDEERRKSEEMAKRQEQLAAQLQAEAFDKASGNVATQGSKTGTYVLYGFVGLSAIIFLTVLLKKD